MDAEDRSVELDFGLTPEEGMDSFWRILGHRIAPQVVVCPEGLGQKIRRMQGMNQDLIESQLAGIQLGAGGTSERTVATPFVEPETSVEKTLAALWSEALAVREVGIDDDFFELGGNSLVAIQLGARIREIYQIDMPMATMFEAANIRKLAEAVESGVLAAVANMSDDAVAAAVAEQGS